MENANRATWQNDVLQMWDSIADPFLRKSALAWGPSERQWEFLALVKQVCFVQIYIKLLDSDTVPLVQWCLIWGKQLWVKWKNSWLLEQNLGGPRRSEISPGTVLMELDSMVKKGCSFLWHWPLHAKINMNRLARVQGRPTLAVVPGRIALWRMAREVTFA